MNDKIYQKQIKLWKTTDTVYYFFYNMEKAELLDYDEKFNAQIMIEYNCRNQEVCFYITRTKEPIIEREEFISANIEYFLNDDIYIPEEIRKALLEIKNYVSKE